MVLDNSDLSKTETYLTSGEGYILFFCKYHFVSFYIQYDAPTYARRTLNSERALSHSSLAKLSESGGRGT